MNTLTREQIFDKLHKSVLPSDRDKRSLITLISKLNKIDHIAIYNIIQKIDKKIYTITEKETMFDLNDVPITQFWKIYEFVILSMENKSRQSDVDKAKQEHNLNEQRFNAFFVRPEGK